jgi:hypothetical protein
MVVKRGIRLGDPVGFFLQGEPVELKKRVGVQGRKGI